MYTRLLIPLDGSKTAETVLPYGRSLARSLEIPVELLGVAGAGEIIALGRRTPENLIAMCTHGRSGIKRWVLGSVTEKVVRLCGDPVLIVRGG